MEGGVRGREEGWRDRGRSEREGGGMEGWREGWVFDWVTVRSEQRCVWESEWTQLHAAPWCILLSRWSPKARTVLPCSQRW